MATEHYNPMNDVLFKFIFGKEEHKHITIDFINSMLERDPAHEVVDLTFKNVEMIPLMGEAKLTRLDVFCTLSSGEKADLEVQVVNHKNMGQGSLYYWAQMYLMSLRKGQDYKSLTPSITINLLRYSFLPQEEPHAMYGVYNPANLHRLTEDMELHFYEIPKFRKKPIGEMTRADRWLAYFASQLDEQEAETMEATAIKDAFNAADLFMQDEEQRLAYVNREMAIMDYQSDMNACREEGANEATINIVKNMLAMGVSPDIIQKATGMKESAILEMQEAT